MKHAALTCLLLTGCATTQAPQEDQPRTQRAYAESACQSVAAFGLIAAASLPVYLVLSPFTSRGCEGVAK